MGQRARADRRDTGKDEVWVSFTLKKLEPQSTQRTLSNSTDIMRASMQYSDDAAGRPILISFVLFVVFSVFTAARSANAASTQHPNIVLIMADDLGYGELGCYGQKIIKTPRIDALAAGGVRFTDFHCGAPVCAPSRCVLMTGKHLGHAAIRNNRSVPRLFPELREKYDWEFPGNEPLPDGEVTVAELLKAAGYATGAIGKWGLGMCGTSGDPNRQGFDLFYGNLHQVQPHNHYPKYLWRNDKKESLPGNA